MPFYVQCVICHTQGYISGDLCHVYLVVILRIHHTLDSRDPFPITPVHILHWETLIALKQTHLRVAQNVNEY